MAAARKAEFETFLSGKRRGGSSLTTAHRKEKENNFKEP
jgi:hypothetical protein